MILAGLTIALTGATGFLGSHIALNLSRRGAAVRGVVRTPSRGDWLRGHGVEFVKADLTNLESLERAFQGCDVVISNAALATRNRASWEMFYEANVIGAENVFHALVAAQVPRVVHISSLGVYSHKGTRRAPINEHHPLRDGFELDLSILTTNWRYSATKALAEKSAQRICSNHNINLTIVRPGPIYGSRDTKITATLTKLVDRPLLPVPTARLPFIHAGDVAEAVSTALERQHAVGQTYNLPGQSHRLDQILNTIRELRGTSCRIIPIPFPVERRFDDSAAIRDLDLTYRTREEGWAEALRIDPYPSSDLP